MWYESPGYRNKHHNSGWNGSNRYRTYDAEVEPVPKRYSQIQYDGCYDVDTPQTVYQYRPMEYDVETPRKAHHRPVEYRRGSDEFIEETLRRNHHPMMEYERPTNYDRRYSGYVQETPRWTHHRPTMEYEPPTDYESRYNRYVHETPRWTHHRPTMEYEREPSRGKANGYTVDDDINTEADNFIKLKHKKFGLSKTRTDKFI